MAASPVTGERPSGFRRSSSQFASLPHRNLSFHEKVGLAHDDAAANVLYAHPSVSIYTFQPPTDALKSLDTGKKTLPDADYPIDAIEILPWRARTETLAARGKLIIEKVQGSVHFLKAGELIHTIMKNSQCWCVDGESKFVMRVGRLRYQRIEMPAISPEDKQKVEEFKQVISKILKFEKTPCPFIRAFQVDLPEDAITPRRRGTWKRKESLNTIPLEDSPHPGRRAKTTRTMSMRGTPPTAFTPRSISQWEVDRPRTASTPQSTGRFSFPDMRTNSPTAYTSGDDNTDSDRHDSESDQPDTGHSSEVDDSDRESSSVPILKSPLNHVQTLSSIADRDPVDVQDVQYPITTSAASQQPTTLTDSISSLDDFRFATVDVPITFPQVSEALTDRSNDCPGVRAGNNASVRVTDHVSEPPVPLLQAQATNMSSTEFAQDIALDRETQPNEREQSPSHMRKDSPLKFTLDISTSESSIVSPAGTSYSEDNLASDSVPRPSIEPPIEPSIEPSTESIIESPPEPDTELVEVESATVLPAEDLELTASNLTRHTTNESATSVDSFHTLFSDDYGPDSYRSTRGTRPFQHRRELSEMTVTAASIFDHDEILLAQANELTEPMPNLEQRDQDHSSLVMRTPGAFADDSRVRRRLQHHRSLSPLPPASILQSSGQIERASPIPTMLIQKAASLAVNKPLEVFVFIVQVLAKIAGGATMNDLFSGELFRRPAVRRTASGTFDQKVRGRSTAKESDDEDDEDDFGVPVHGHSRSANKEDETDVILNQEIDDAASFASID